jgi:hypothetical protein
MTGVWIFFGIYLACGMFGLALCRAAARGDEQAKAQYEATSEHYSGHGSINLTQREYDYYVATHGQTFPSSTSQGGQRARVLRPATASDQPSDSGRRGDH